MIKHVVINVRDLSASEAFYTTALAPLGIELVAERHGWRGFGARPSRGSGSRGVRRRPLRFTPRFPLRAEPPLKRSSRPPLESGRQRSRPSRPATDEP